jgi:MFS family permease
VRLLPWTATLFVVAPFAGKLVNRIGERPLVVVGLVLQAFGMVWIGIIAVPNLSYPQLVIPLIVTGAGASMAMPAAQNAVLSSVAGSDIGKVSGTFNMLRYLGGVFGIAILAAIFAHIGNFHSPQAFSKGFAMAIGASAILSAVAAIAGLWLPLTTTAASSIAAIMPRETQSISAMSGYQADRA